MCCCNIRDTEATGVTVSNNSLLGEWYLAGPVLRRMAVVTCPTWHKPPGERRKMCIGLPYKHSCMDDPWGKGLRSDSKQYYCISHSSKKFPSKTGSSETDPPEQAIHLGQTRLGREKIQEQTLIGRRYFNMDIWISKLKDLGDNHSEFMKKKEDSWNQAGFRYIRVLSEVSWSKCGEKLWVQKDP